MPLFAGKTWFRNNIAPYLTKIKSEICKQPPVVHSTTPIIVYTGQITHVILDGDYFHPGVTVYLPFIYGAVTNVNWINFHTIEFDIFVGSDSTVQPLITTCEGSVTIDVTSITTAWVDLRLGSGSAFTEQHRAGTSINRDSEGLYSDGVIWENWYKFDSHTWDRVSENKKVSIIMKNSGSAHMFGIMGNEQDESATAQYYQAEVYAYYTSSGIGRFYGTDAAHNGQSDNFSGTYTPTQPYMKIEYDDNGEAGAEVRFYDMVDLSNFNAGTLILTTTVGAVLDADSTTLYVAATTTATARMVAFKLEDM